MRKLFTAVTIATFLLSASMPAAGQGVSDDSLQGSSQDSSKDSLGASSQQSSDSTTQNSGDSSATSFQDSTANSSNESSSSTGTGSPTVTLVVLGAVVLIGVTVGGIILTVNVSKVKEDRVIDLQDQIYLAEGKDYDQLLAYFEVDDMTLAMANDELVASGYLVRDDQDAADYLARLMLLLAERSPKVQAGLLSGG